jgi:2-C-methyl-D-erythritol 4-phosphate cytidylyltransferase
MTAPGGRVRSMAGAVGVVVPVAGPGRRFGTHGPEALVPVAGRPMLAWVLQDLERSACVGQVVVASHPDALSAVQRLAPAGVSVVAGGVTRQQNVAAGLAALAERLEYVALHDASRPLAGSLLDLLAELLAAGPDGISGVVPGTPVSDTIREVDDAGRSKGIVDRERLRGMQTPQLFVRGVLERALADGIDEAALIERGGDRIRIVPGLVENLKVSTSLDLLVAEVILARRHGRQ